MALLKVKSSDRKLAVHIRFMIRRDMPEILAIENQCFEFTWDEDAFIRQLRRRNCIGMVCQAAEKVVGYMVYELHSIHLRLLNLAVHEDFRYRGIARQMIDKLIGKLSQARRSRISLEILERNLDAQLCFKRLGFRAIATLRNFHEETDEDAYVFRYCLRLN